MMQSREYWRQRSAVLEDAVNRNAGELTLEIEREFNLAQKEITEQIEQWYGRFSRNNNIPLNEARQRLLGRDFAEFRWDINEYIRHGNEVALNPAYIRQLENASARVHVSKLEALQLKTQNTMERLYGRFERKTTSLFSQIYQNNYYHELFELQRGFNIGYDVAALDPRRLERVLSRPWTLDNSTFGDRIWSQKESLLNEVHTQLTRNMLLGKAPDDAIRAIANKFNTSKHNAGRLIMTESAYFANEAQKDAYVELGVKQFEIVVTFDEATCGVCGAMSGKVLPMAQYDAGVTTPPFHPWCRCFTSPYFEDNNAGERFMRHPDGTADYVPADMNFEEWQKEYVENSGKENGGNFEQESEDISVPKEYIDDYSDFQSLSLSEQARETLETLHIATQNDGFEHGATVMSDGSVYEFSSGEEARVRVPKEIMTLIDSSGENSVHLLHSHTNVTPPSAIDFRWLLEKSIDKISVVAHNKDVFSVYVGDGWRPMEKEFNEAVSMISRNVNFDVMDFPGFDDWTIQERTYVAIREQAFRIARQFKWTLEGGSLR